ncbi:hypothetical protein AXG93_3943s1120 [Marchantia polymorpha subsp. ruderalis]|uniref:FH2 domain-containing protein n=1 Tax=Marchantia polymorpha subsp. ruderalis TaxID=1480154 RepID=A0A176WE53_MARPO|nr:hypothetical protein AXG93_3943s1120 [Marchantia polymorpha subsp. ruderalis]
MIMTTMPVLQSYCGLRPSFVPRVEEERLIKGEKDGGGQAGPENQPYIQHEEFTGFQPLEVLWRQDEVTESSTRSRPIEDHKNFIYQPQESRLRSQKLQERMMAQGCLPPLPGLRHGTKTSMKCSVEEILAAFTSHDVSSLEEEALDNVLKLFPTSDQMGRFGDCAMDPKISRAVAELYVQMIHIPFADQILENVHFKLNFRDRVSQLSKDLLLLSRVCRDAMRSAKLRWVLDMIPTSHVHKDWASHPHAPRPEPSIRFQVLPHPGHKLWPISPPLPPTPPPSPTPSHLNLLHFHSREVASHAAAAAAQGEEDAEQQTKIAYPRPSTQLPPASRADVLWNMQHVEVNERCPHYSWLGHDNVDRRSTSPEVYQACDMDSKQGCSSLPSPSPPPSPPLPSPLSWVSSHKWQHSGVEKLKTAEEEHRAKSRRIEYGYEKLRAAGNKQSSVMLELCRNLSRESADLMDFSIDSEIPCLKDAVGSEVRSWRSHQKEFLQLRAEFDEAFVLWKHPIRDCVEKKSTQEMMDAFFAEGEQDLQNLSLFLFQVESSTRNLLFRLEADSYRRRKGYLDDDEPIVAIFLNFVECFKTTAAEIQLEKQRALQLPKVNLLDSIFTSDDPTTDANHLKTFLSLCPSKNELDVFKNLVQEEGGADSAQDKLAALLNTPNIHGKLKLLSIKKNLPAQCQKLRFQLRNLMKAADEIVLSVEFHSVLKLAFLLWCTPESADFHGEDEIDQAVAWTGSNPSEIQTKRITFLYDLHDKLLLRLVKYIAEKYPELLEFHKTLPHLESGNETAGNLATIADEIRALLKNLDDMESELSHLRREVESWELTEGASTLSRWMSFLLDAEAEYESVLRAWQDARHSTNGLHDFLQRNSWFQVEYGMSAIHSFVMRFQQAALTLACEVQEASQLQQLQAEGERKTGGEAVDQDHGLKKEERRSEVAQADEKE